MIDDVMVLDCFNIYNALVFESINLIYAIIMIDGGVSIDAFGRAWYWWMYEFSPSIMHE